MFFFSVERDLGQLDLISLPVDHPQTQVLPEGKPGPGLIALTRVRGGFSGVQTWVRQEPLVEQLLLFCLSPLSPPQVGHFMATRAQRCSGAAARGRRARPPRRVDASKSREFG